MDPVTTTDELIPSGETSSFRSNPLGLAEFTLSRRDPGYVGRSKKIAALEKLRIEGTILVAWIRSLRRFFPDPPTAGAGKCHA
jgi:aconitase A